MTKFRIGRHINVSLGLTTAPEYGYRIGCEIIQVFLGVPQQVISKARPTSGLEELAEKLEEYKLKLVIHASYTINLCHPPKNKMYQTSLKSLVQDLNASEIIGSRCLGVIIHMGKNIKANGLTDKQAIKNYIQGLKDALSETSDNTTIILETGASQGTEVGSKLDQLKEIYNGLTEEEKQRVKFCIDTCHIWATGYDISTKEGVNNFFEEFEEKIGIDKIVCIHFNDSRTKLNSHVDRHADLGYGFIGNDGLKIFAKTAKKYKIPLIMETPLDAVNPKTNADVTFSEELAKVKKWTK